MFAVQVLSYGLVSQILEEFYYCDEVLFCRIMTKLRFYLYFSVLLFYIHESIT